jgi:uncharacterized membrane protein YgdD (TMEM256/DUF423 family)
VIFVNPLQEILKTEHYLYCMVRTSLLSGSIFAALAVILGAMGAHALKEGGQLTDVQLNSWDTGARYQMYHAFALIAVGIIARVFGETKMLKAAMWLFVIGILFFSGSIYILSTRNITGIEAGFLGPVTPVGGLLFIGGWICVLIAVVRNKSAV